MKPQNDRKANSGIDDTPRLAAYQRTTLDPSPRSSKDIAQSGPVFMLSPAQPPVRS
jgi:hypothetical protein